MWMGGNASYKRCPRNLTDFEATWPHVEVWWLGEWCWSLGKSTKNTIWIHLIQFVGHFHQFSCGITLGNHWVSISMLIYWNYFILLEGNSFQFCSIFPPAPLMQDIFLDHFSNGPWPLYDPQKWTFSIDLGKNNWWTDGRNSSFFTGCWQIKHLATRLVNLV